jgi:hypothetical protein
MHVSSEAEFTMPKILKTERLILRSWTLEDASLQISKSRAAVRHYVATGKRYATIEQANDFLRRSRN